jgi:DNA-binding response OmpR family regulator
MDPAHLPRVLIAEDDPEMRAYIRHGLRASALVTEAADGAEAFDAARQNPPDLVIADIQMPGLDGHALCAALHADAATQRVRVLLVSGDLRGTHACADGVLLKPFNLAGLRAAVGRLLPPPAGSA